MNHQKLLTIIEEHKEGMNSNLYLQLLNELKKDYDSDNIICNVIYLQPVIKNIFISNYKIEYQQKNQLILLSKESFNNYKNTIEQYGYILNSSCLNFSIINKLNYNSNHPFYSYMVDDDEINIEEMNIDLSPVILKINQI